MAVVDENWQTKRSTIVERTTFIFNSQLLSDVKFVVPMSTGESESKKVIPAFTSGRRAQNTSSKWN